MAVSVLVSRAQQGGCGPAKSDQGSQIRKVGLEVRPSLFGRYMPRLELLTCISALSGLSLSRARFRQRRPQYVVLALSCCISVYPQPSPACLDCPRPLTAASKAYWGLLGRGSQINIPPDLDLPTYPGSRVAAPQPPWGSKPKARPKH